MSQQIEHISRYENPVPSIKPNIEEIYKNKNSVIFYTKCFCLGKNIVTLNKNVLFNIL